MQTSLVYSTQLQSLSEPDQYDALADAYLDSALRLCKVLERSTKSATYQRGTVVMYLTHHSVELFLKGAILRRSSKESFNHDLEHIANRYHAIYPEKRFRLKVPFSVSNLGVRPEEHAAARHFIKTRTERLRYPVDKTGKSWGGTHAFNAGSFTKVLLELRGAYVSIRGCRDS